MNKYFLMATRPGQCDFTRPSSALLSVGRMHQYVTLLSHALDRLPDLLESSRAVCCALKNHDVRFKTPHFS